MTDAIHGLSRLYASGRRDFDVQTQKAWAAQIRSCGESSVTDFINFWGVDSRDVAPTVADFEKYHQSTLAAEVIGQMFSAVKADLTPVEVNLWTRELNRLGASVMLAFAEFWISGGGQGGYRKAPTIADFLKYSDPNYVSVESALEILRTNVASIGPYNDPKISDPKLQNAVVFMGGWVKVCDEMPDPADDFAWKRYADRFRLAFTQSEALQVQRRLSAQPLLGLFSSAQQLHTASIASAHSLLLVQIDNSDSELVQAPTST